MNLVLNCFTIKYAVFSGRAPRKEYWLFVLAMVILGVIAQIIEINAGLYYMVGLAPVGILSILTVLALLIPSTAVAVRRLHDTNRSWAWLIIVYLPAIILFALNIIAVGSMMGVVGSGADEANSEMLSTFVGLGIASAFLFIPIGVIQLVGVVWLFVLFVLKGTEGENRFGPDPLAARTADTGETA